MYTVIGTSSGITVLLDVRTMRLTHRYLAGAVQPGDIITDAQITRAAELAQAWPLPVWRETILVPYL